MGLTHPLSAVYTAAMTIRRRYRCCFRRTLNIYINCVVDCLSRLDSLRLQFNTPCSRDLLLICPRSYSISEILKAQHRHPLTLLPLHSLRLPGGTTPRLFPPEDVSCSALAILRFSACGGSSFDGRDAVNLVDGRLFGWHRL